EELLNKTPLINSGYEIVHEESPDNRGIDVGLIYLKDKLKLLEWEALEVKFPEENAWPTRDVLYAKFLVFEKDTLHTFVNHWPSRYGGQVATEPKRMLAAQVIVNKMDEIEKRDANANIFITGDLNDEPEDISVKEVLNAHKKPEDGHLINLTANLGWNIGTHKYQGQWSVLDHIIISKALWYGKRNLKVKNQRAHVFSQDWLLEEDPTHQGVKPNRTYLGPRYNGGYSDHLPVYVDIKLINLRQSN
ncbi:MAG: endonuclease/exonuclease/phosphatase family protein, partial [Chitinophagales bacterium]